MCPDFPFIVALIPLVPYLFNIQKRIVHSENTTPLGNLIFLLSCWLEGVLFIKTLSFLAPQSIRSQEDSQEAPERSKILDEEGQVSSAMKKGNAVQTTKQKLKRKLKTLVAILLIFLGSG